VNVLLLSLLSLLLAAVDAEIFCVSLVSASIRTYTRLVCAYFEKINTAKLVGWRASRASEHENIGPLEKARNQKAFWQSIKYINRHIYPYMV
jgi:hypothetical protein